MAVLDSLEMYKNLFENLPVAIIVTDIKTGLIVDVNNEACTLIGISNNKLIGMSQSQLHPTVNEKSIKDKFNNIIKSLLSGEKVPAFEEIIYDSNEDIIPVEISSTLLEVNDKKLIIGVIKDLREKKLKENILDFYDRALEKSSSYLALVDKDYTYLSVNESYAKTFDKSKKEIIGSKVEELFGSDYFHNVVKDRFDEALDGSSVEFESSYNHKGTVFHLQVHYDPYYSIDNKIIGVVVNIFDLTKYKEYEEENTKKEKLLIQQSKMAAMGEMLENIAHQWRQPLSLISTCTSGIILQKEFNALSDESLSDSLKKIMNTTAYLSNTIDDFKNFFKRDKEKHDFSINTKLDKTLDLLEMSFDSNNIEIEKNYKYDLVINSYKNEFMQVLFNILNNAKDALLSNEKAGDRKVVQINVYKENKKSVIEIIDSAGGIPESFISKIFEPYFTTKHQSQGTGIGLFMTREIITKHMDGLIEVENKKFQVDGDIYYGAMFKIII